MGQYVSNVEFALYGLTPAALASFSDDQKTAALVAASAHADGYIGQRYKLPLNGTIPADLKMHVAKIAAWFIMSGRGFKPGSTDGDSLHDAYNDATKWLQQVAEGKATIAGVTDADTEDADTTDTGQGSAFVVSPQPYSVGVGSNYDRAFEKDPCQGVGGAYVGPPRLRGW